MSSVLLFVGIIVGVPLILFFGATSSKSNKSNKIKGDKPTEEGGGKETKKEIAVAEVEGAAGPGIKYFTLEEYEDIIRIEEDAEGKISSELIRMINDIPKGELTPCSFTDLSIFDIKERGNIAEDMAKIEGFFMGCEDIKFTEKELRAMGSMLGMAIADAMGHRFEFAPLVYCEKPELVDMGKGIGGSFKLKPGQWTDDTSMGLCLADSLLVCGGEWNPHDCMHRFLSWWHGGYNNAFRYDKPRRSSCGLGGNISMSFRRYLREPEPYTKAGDENVSGNGSIMRVCPVPILYHDDEEKAMDISAKQSLVTHQGKEAAECCRLMAHIIVHGLNGENLKGVLDDLGSTFTSEVDSVQKLARSEQEGDDPDRDWRWKIDGQYKFSPSRAKSNPGYIGSYAMDAMAMSLNILWNTDNFRDAVIKIVNLRGDSDSTGAVLGQIAGAFYGMHGIPNEWIKVVSMWDKYTIPLRAYMLVNKHFIQN